jgi:hypothetical protein
MKTFVEEWVFLSPHRILERKWFDGMLEAAFEVLIAEFVFAGPFQMKMGKTRVLGSLLLL